MVYNNIYFHYIREYIMRNISLIHESVFFSLYETMYNDNIYYYYYYYIRRYIMTTNIYLIHESVFLIIREDI